MDLGPDGPCSAFHGEHTAGVVHMGVLQKYI